MIAKPRVFFVLGGPGTGKGTQCLKLQGKHGFVHISAGDELRKERETPRAQLIQDHIAKGSIVPVFIFLKLKGEITVELLKQAMEENGWEDVMTQRIRKRSIDSNRIDDNLETLQKRFQTYLNDTKQIIQHYQHLNQVITIDAAQEVDLVFEQLEKELKL